ncbi:hypothetical protein M407DRAFT_15500 [Tulasnella calospora MUT 4182]|uniref:Cytochrome P450 n=1 Tax=Tulasnella calospora MUT 4182 TaxID=1051891 RepID=A0A0C3KR61_9AGAM|nr:hypothetical protein M407DRAFT_15500 [Tulasnella calospora MUT 4182]
MPSLNPVSTAAAVAGAAVLYKVLQIGKRDADLPPGPPTRPVVGNLLDFPTSYAHLTFEKWAKEYGEVFSLKITNGTIVSLNSPQAVRFVLDKKNSSTSNRPELYVLNYITNGLFLGFMQAGPEWKIMRRAVTEILKPQAVDRHLPIQYAESAQFMFDLMSKPEEHYNHCARYAVSVVVSIVFGQRIPRYDSPLAATFRGNTDVDVHPEFQVLDDLVKPGSTPPVDLIPILHYVPERWAKWKTLIRTQKERHRVFYDWLLSTVETRIAEGRGNGCLIETLLKPGEDSTKNYMHNFLRIMVNHQAEQEKAQEEIDRVVGRDRMPSADDIANLPYVQAIVREVIRFRPFAPLGLPHKATEDVAYRGYRIPSNAVLLLNVWCIFHDETLFDQPEIFRPQRFLESPTGIKEGLEAKAYPLLNDIVFGAGRRVCPAMHLARNSLNGSCSPNPFECDIRPRSRRHAQIVRETFIESTPGCAPFEQELDDEDMAFLRAARDEASQNS